MATLEQEFEDAIWESVIEGKKLGYSPSIFLRMCEEHGVKEACRRLMDENQVPYGVYKLKTLNRLDLTIEAIVYDNPKFQALFPKQTLDNAFARLSALGYPEQERPSSAGRREPLRRA
jgi:hypothetical protein